MPVRFLVWVLGNGSTETRVAYCLAEGLADGQTDGRTAGRDGRDPDPTYPSVVPPPRYTVYRRWWLL